MQVRASHVRPLPACWLALMQACDLQGNGVGPSRQQQATDHILRWLLLLSFMTSGREQSLSLSIHQQFHVRRHRHVCAHPRASGRD